MKIHQGDIFWLTLEADSEMESIPHPHVVIQDTVENQSLVKSVVVCAITSNMKKSSWPGNVILDKGEGNLTRVSIVDVSNVHVVNKKDLGDYIGSLSMKRIEEIFTGIDLVQSFHIHRN